LPKCPLCGTEQMEKDNTYIHPGGDPWISEWYRRCFVCPKCNHVDYYYSQEDPSKINNLSINPSKRTEEEEKEEDGTAWGDEEDDDLEDEDEEEDE